MNKSIITQTLLILLTIIATPLYSMLGNFKDIVKKTEVCNQKEMKANEKNEKNLICYREGVQLIDKIAKKQSTEALIRINAELADLTSSKTQHQKKNIIDSHICSINTQLNQIERKMRQKEKIFIQDLTQNLTHDQCNIVQLLTKAYCNYADEYMSQSHEDVTHDKGFPDAIMKMILTKNNIDPHSVRLICSPSDTKDETFASAASMGADILCDNGRWSISNVIQPPRIIAYPHLATRSPIFQGATFIHEAEHLKEHHQIKKNVLTFVTSVYTGTKEEAITDHPTYNKWITMHEKQAEIFPALRDPDWTRLIRTARAQEYYPGHLYLKHYAQLAEIDELHNIKDELKKL